MAKQIISIKKSIIRFLHLFVDGNYNMRLPFNTIQMNTCINLII